MGPVIDKSRTVLRTLHYAYRTEMTYLDWICRFFSFKELADPEQLEKDDVKTYLEYLATKRQVSASTQRQTLNAIVFLFDKVLGKPLGISGLINEPDRHASFRWC
jgi:hypothetical protein